MDKGEHIFLYGGTACTKAERYTMSLHIEQMKCNHRWLVQNLPLEKRIRLKGWEANCGAAEESRSHGYFLSPWECYPSVHL